MTNFKRITFLWLAALVSVMFFLGSCSDKNKEFDIKLAFAPGEQYLYTTEVAQKINSFGIEVKHSMGMDMIYEILDTANSFKHLKVTYDHINMSIGDSQYDSKTAADTDEGFGFMSRFIGQSFELYIAPNGEIDRVEGLKDFISKLSDLNEQTRSEIESQFSDTSIRSMMQSSFDLYPGKPVKVGESWVKKSKMKVSGIQINVENTYTLQAVEGGKAIILVASTMDLPEMEMPTPHGAPMSIALQGKQNGSIDLELKTGQILNSKVSQNIKGNVQLSGQSMPMEIDGDITIKSKKL